MLGMRRCVFLCLRQLVRAGQRRLLRLRCVVPLQLDRFEKSLLVLFETCCNDALGMFWRCVRNVLATC